MEVTVKRNNLRTSPTKIRPTLYIVRGKNAKHSLDILKFTNKGCAKDLYELLKSGIAAAKEREMNEDQLYIKVIKCDGAGMYKRHRFGSRGRVVRIVKRNSHLTITLSDEFKSDKIKKDDKAVSKSELKPETKPVTTKKTTAKNTVKQEDKSSK